MQINATHNLKPLSEPARPPVARLADQEQDAAVFANRDAISQKLNRSPDARPEAVALARTLVAHPAYPPDVTIRGIASLLANKLTSSKE